MKTPEIAENVFTAPDAVILGDVQIEEECSIWFHAVVRAEAELSLIHISEPTRRS